MAGGNSGNDNRNNNTVGANSYDSMNREKQNKHIPGTKEYDSSKSSFIISADELDELIRSNMDKAEMLSSGKMELELPKDVGLWKSSDGSKSESINRVTLHTAKTGYHAVPAKRKDKKGGKNNVVK